MARILHISTRFAKGGAERNTAQIMTWQVEAGHQVFLAVGPDPDPTIVPAGVKVIEFPELVREVRPVADLKAIQRLRFLTLRGRYDLVHTHNSKAGVVGRLAAAGTASKIVHTVHGTSFGSDHSRAVSEAFLRIERYCAARTDVMICVGDELRTEFLKAGVGRPEQYRVIRSPVEVDSFARARSMASDERRSILARLGVPEDRPILLMVGALEPRKRSAWIVNILRPILSARRARLIIAGEGPEQGEIEETVWRSRLDGVHLVVHITEMPQLMAASHVLVHASRAEGVSQVVIQALIVGLPIVATDVTGLREVAGAPVRAVPVSGEGFVSAVTHALAEPVAAVPLDAFESWKPANVRRAYEQLLESLLPGDPQAR